MKAKQFLTGVACAALCACMTLSAATEDPVAPYNGYGPAMKSTAEDPLTSEWLKDHADAVAEAASDEAVAAIVADKDSADMFLASLRDNYDTDPTVAIILGAVSQWVMRPDPCCLFFWKDRPSAGRKVWVKALLHKAETTTLPGVARLCLDQLRWCGKPQCPKFRARLERLADTSADEGVKDLVRMILAQKCAED